ncbi:hypothetical protein JMJ77_0008812 [Colletotrichum scovillei]|uniref:Uncharacterized protein n=1 Tax=Colletotrichum scovillei TaxID=1209932 RepID=A0A9P7QTD4_9PEZI|nr:hypothetical protein JMJ78_0001702 [Colletotrichum scovillei]KAG7041107.1 hypothetical protein JMJ77_0008812 [Colletotrichum scovillei]KAG7061140.1 hypothetical protein JMJ76_0010210 [Colletotrichum scovillei]
MSRDPRAWPQAISGNDAPMLRIIHEKKCFGNHDGGTSSSTVVTTYRAAATKSLNVPCQRVYCVLVPL